MDYRIITEYAEDTKYYVLVEYREGKNEPWTVIADDKRRAPLERYKQKLEKGWL